MSFEAEIVKAFRTLRLDVGVTPAKLQAQGVLMHLLQAQSGEEGVERLRQLCDGVEDRDQRIAVKNALALDYPALGGPDKRRTAITLHPPDGTADFPFSTRTHRRREEEGFILLAKLLTTAPEGKNRRQQNLAFIEEMYLKQQFSFKQILEHGTAYSGWRQQLRLLTCNRVALIAFSVSLVQALVFVLSVSLRS